MRPLVDLFREDASMATQELRLQTEHGTRMPRKTELDMNRAKVADGEVDIAEW